jgi:hypothetical protein
VLDELSLMLVPIVVGSGMRRFDDMSDQVALEVVPSRALGVACAPTSTGTITLRTDLITRPPCLYFSWSTDSTLPDGSLNQAM